MRTYNRVEETRMPPIIKVRKHRRIDPAVAMRPSVAGPIPVAIGASFFIFSYHSLKPRLVYPDSALPSGNLSQDHP